MTSLRLLSQPAKVSSDYIWNLSSPLVCKTKVAHSLPAWLHSLLRLKFYWTITSDKTLQGFAVLFGIKIRHLSLTSLSLSELLSRDLTLIQYWTDRRNQVKMANGAIGNNSKWTAGIIIIGDEILNGLTKDANSYYLYKKLWSLGGKS